MAKAKAVPLPWSNPEAGAFITRSLFEQSDGIKRAVNTNPFSSGVLLENIQITSLGSAQVSHALGYTPKGFIVTKIQNGYGVTWNGATKNTITLNNVGPTTVNVSVWVF